MKRMLVTGAAALAFACPAAAAAADPLVDACNNVEPDVHVDVYNVVEACFDYPRP